MSCSAPRACAFRILGERDRRRMVGNGGECASSHHALTAPRTVALPASLMTKRRSSRAVRSWRSVQLGCGFGQARRWRPHRGRMPLARMTSMLPAGTVTAAARLHRLARAQTLQDDRRLARIGRRADPGVDAEIGRRHHALPIERGGNALHALAAGGKEGRNHEHRHESAQRKGIAQRKPRRGQSGLERPCGTQAPARCGRARARPHAILGRRRASRRRSRWPADAAGRNCDRAAAAPPCVLGSAQQQERRKCRGREQEKDAEPDRAAHRRQPQPEARARRTPETDRRRWRPRPAPATPAPKRLSSALVQRAREQRHLRSERAGQALRAVYLQGRSFTSSPCSESCPGQADVTRK